MGLRMFLLLCLVMVVLTDHSQGVPETHEQPLIITDVSDVGKPLITANLKSTLGPHIGLCNCKGKESEMVSRRCHCQQSARRNGRRRKLKTLCQRQENKNLRVCRMFSKLKKGSNKKKFGPSVPI